MTDDLISRKATIEWINKMFCEPCKEKRDLYGGVVCRACLIDDAIGAIETAPSAQKKPCDDCQQFDCYGCEYVERKEE